MTPEQLSDAIVAALTSLVDAGRVTLSDPVPSQVRVERPKVKEHGDYATNIAMQLGKKAGMNPREFAELLATELAGADGISAAEVAGPGFLNIRVAAGAQGEIARHVLEAGATYGHGAPTGRKVDLEFISANPTGPLHLGHTRWAAVGDAIARVMAAAGDDVTREFYINDRGNQMDKFGASLMARAHGEEPPEDGYHGAYVADLAARIVEADPGITSLPRDEQAVAFREAGYALQLHEHQSELAELNTHFDVWFSERSLHESDAVDRSLARLREQGRLFEADGATWMRTTDFGDDKDRVLLRGNGELTYFASDTAYYVDKRDRGFDTCIYLLGADHHGYVGRLNAMAACVGDTPGEQIQVLIGQLVKILQNGQELKLSKRAGTIVSLRELIDLIGVDPLRYTLIRYPADSPLTLDVAEMTRKSNDNPVYYVQYAHARLSSIVRNGADLGLAADLETFDPSQLVEERAGALLRALAEFPRVVARAAELREPHRIARYLEETASTFHKFYDECRVLPQGDEEPTDTHRARLVLVAATRQVLANGLDLLGVSAPDRM
ncbi:arginine--tRNA ligase [Aeromicrobium sp. 636]|uniref:Arginine--tRNA ligase n=1 Tax=Aeromicrobium senzhongii TaxID=2663859 RepID=A0A8I0K046_9ACTN|nr:MULTISPECIES: arginine--tRNA ligase [Aeromicrobium]MBC9226657.1 arginine--tRNA ligase [Aeromicrobium senzhongii]MCQ3998758.1 arginine--tRNA ligase [Aeromicrobium sp. 636]MTB89184.1 arginine--tRNA ligase [Aeromicrobium senzhongii]QNL93548.1 arginine--tRNA ligase [Aeromicrobium senzhongii]